MKSLSWISLVLIACVLSFSAQGPSWAIANPESAVTSVADGFITAVLRSECTDAPSRPPPVGGIAMGPDYVIMTVADGDPLDYVAAQRLVTDAVFESLMPFYCALAQNPTRGCVTNRVQWNLLTYDAGGNPKVSGGPTTGPAYH